MPSDNASEAVIGKFKRRDLERILGHRGVILKAANHAQMIRKLVTDQPALLEELVTAINGLKGVSVNGIIRELYTLDSTLGPVVGNCRTKSALVTELACTDRLEMIAKVADYARYERKRQVSPMRFEGKPRPRVVQSRLPDAVNEVVRELNEDRPNVLVFRQASFSPETSIIRVAISREVGRRHVTQRPERAPIPEMAEHDDYPLRPHVIEVDLNRQRVRTTFGRSDIDGMTVTKAVLERFIQLKELKDVEFRSNMLDAASDQKVAESIDKAVKRSGDDSRVQATLNSLEKAPKVSLTVSGLNIVGDLRKLDIEAGDVDKVLKSLGVEKAMLEGAHEMGFEIELPDGRRIRVSRRKLTFVGNFTLQEQEAIEDVFSK